MERYWVEFVPIERETFLITDLSKYAFEMLSEDGEFGLSRGALDGAPSLLVVAPVSAQPSAKKPHVSRTRVRASG